MSSVDDLNVDGPYTGSYEGGNVLYTWKNPNMGLMAMLEAATVVLLLLTIAYLSGLIGSGSVPSWLVIADVAVVGAYLLNEGLVAWKGNDLRYYAGQYLPAPVAGVM